MVVHPEIHPIAQKELTPGLPYEIPPERINDEVEIFPESSDVIDESSFSSENLFSDVLYNEEIPFVDYTASSADWDNYSDEPTRIDIHFDAQSDNLESQNLCRSQLTAILIQIEKEENSDDALEDLEDLFHKYNDVTIQSILNNRVIDLIDQVFDDLYSHAVDLFLISSHLTALGIFRLCLSARPMNSVVEHNIEKLETLVASSKDDISI